MNFITTKDIETKETLEKLGYQLFSEKDGIYTFLNCQEKKEFSKDMKNVVFTNKLCI